MEAAHAPKPMPISMRDVSRTLVICVAGALFLSSPSLALRKVSAEAGYVATSVSKYASGLVYGVGIMEGTGRFGFGLSLLRFANSFSSAVFAVDPDTRKVSEHKYHADLSDFYITILATYMRENPKKQTLLVASMGPQIHFLAASSQDYVQAVRLDARDSRLGMGAVLRYEKVIRMFGRTTFFISGAWSWMQAGIEVVDEFTPPPESVVLGTITAGLAFPF